MELMDKAASQFYQAALGTDCHGFLEFTGLLREYVKICHEFQKNNPHHDFRRCNIHNNHRLHLQPYQREYIHEKLSCIYQDEIFPNSNHLSD
ncbi:hypothetical protein [Laspinema olomoucense]|uniref:hypothetical protein n=1 Tax=Laspinema olomoucense TaxID=3231600 RepID=UPI0021BA597C|nr:hypothetical protein [Laspinema sp. D3c]